jgi:hypothetical protein
MNEEIHFAPKVRTETQILQWDDPMKVVLSVKELHVVGPGFTVGCWRELV